MPQLSTLSPLAGIPLAILAGVAIPLQGRINGALGVRLGDGIAAALVSFSTGLVLMIAISTVLPVGRAGIRRVMPALRARSFPRYYVGAGAFGAFFVYSQSATIGVLGVALFTVAAVAGQSLSGIAVDRAGLGPAGKRPVTAGRVIGAALTVLAVVWAVSPRLGGTAGSASWLLPVLLPVAAGVLLSFQQAMNGTAAVHYGTPVTATLVHFVAGAAVLLVAWIATLPVAVSAGALPSEWWYYLGGPLGCVYIGFASVLVRHLGVLLTGLSMIGGQLIGSLLLDALHPTPGNVIGAETVAGTILTLFAIALTTLPWGERRSGR